MEQQSVVVRKRRSSPKSPSAAPLSRFLSTRTPKSAVDLMIVCAVTGEDYWESMMTPEVAASIHAETALEEKFLTNLCKQPGTRYAHNVVDAYLSNLDPEQVAAFFSDASLKKRNHPANLCLYGASFGSEGGINLTNVLGAMIRHGLSIDALVQKKFADIERAASLGHREFLRLVIPEMKAVPEEVIRFILTKSMNPVNSICILLDECGVDVNLFTNPKMMEKAKQEARCYIHARLSRAKRIQELEIKDDDDLFGDGAMKQRTTSA